MSVVVNCTKVFKYLIGGVTFTPNTPTFGKLFLLTITPLFKIETPKLVEALSTPPDFICTLIS